MNGVDIPQWALDKAAETFVAASANARSVEAYRELAETKAFARYIAAHEQPPADPLYDALKAVVELGRYDTREQTQLLRAELAQRGFCIGPASKEPAA